MSQRTQLNQSVNHLFPAPTCNQSPVSLLINQSLEDITHTHTHTHTQGVCIMLGKN